MPPRGGASALHDHAGIAEIGESGQEAPLVSHRPFNKATGTGGPSADAQQVENKGAFLDRIRALNDNRPVAAGPEPRFHHPGQFHQIARGPTG